MDITQLIVTAGGAALIGLTLVFFFGKQPAPRHEGSDQLYGCPMHPWITSNDPTADCTVCGMKLVRNEKANN